MKKKSDGDTKTGTTQVSDSAILQSVAAQRSLAETLFSDLARCGPDTPGITRDTYGDGENRAHAVVSAQAKRLGLDVSRDAAANTYMTWPGRDRASPQVLTGSHLDSVPHGGNFDGAAGVVAGLVATAALKSLGLTPACDITTMGVRAEESVWFQVSYIGSRGALGVLAPNAFEAKRIDTGRTLFDHMTDCGADPAAVRGGARALDPARIRAFLEVHIEQAPSLAEAGLPVGICTGIPGNFRYPDARIIGEYAHVGLPRRFRRDAAIAAAEFAQSLDALWAEYEAAGQPMACTLGRFHTDSAKHAMTVVPGEFLFSLDVRAYDEAQLREVEARLLAIISGIETRRRVKFELGQRASAAVGVVDPNIRAALEERAGSLGIPAMPLGSPASHDAAAFAAAGVPAAMIFIRNPNGSHHPDEAMAVDDFMQAATVLTAWLADNVCGGRSD